ncbi:MAG: (deoxy)nucleoside triphosphate pyrophosphohydrolase [Verrucomicrobia bacterium]|nr:(deoxy)nucleoside triphosphate pyrophosphohydrolase [Verrucomicrobiota bacterium]
MGAPTPSAHGGDGTHAGAPAPCGTAPGPDTTEVAAGLIFRGDRLLLAQRPPTAHLGGLWEFPGGKRQPGESFPDCLRRELREELGVEVDVLEPVASVLHDYPGKRVRLEFYRCRLTRGEPQALDGPALAWVGRDELDRYELPPADARLLRRLRTASNLWSDPEGIENR